MTLRPTVSIAMATYNGDRFLETQLASLASQTLAPLELVIGDDRSSDSTAEVVTRFSRSSPFPVRFGVNPARLNYGENFIQAALRCQGKYVAFCDQDDVWEPTKLERCIEALETTGALLCAHDAYLVDAQGARIGYFKHRPKAGLHAALSLDPWGAFFGFTVVFRRDLLDLLSPEKRPDDNIQFDRKLAHDRWVYFLATTFGSSFYISAPLAHYRQHDRNAFGGREIIADLGTRVRAAAADQTKHMEICGQRRALLSELSEHGEFAPSARKAAAYWDRLAGFYRLRIVAAAAPSLLGRLGAIVRLAAAGAYRSFARHGLSPKAFAKDVVVAVAAVARRNRPA
jgi:glycosyltransferase involved in cell wall biosynthesis